MEGPKSQEHRGGRDSFGFENGEIKEGPPREKPMNWSWKDGEGGATGEPCVHSASQQSRLEKLPGAGSWMWPRGHRKYSKVKEMLPAKWPGCLSLLTPLPPPSNLTFQPLWPEVREMLPPKPGS